MSNGVRVALTAAVIGASTVGGSIYNSASTIVLGTVAGNQFENSNLAHIETNAIFSAFSFINITISLVVFLIILGIWFKPLKNFFNEVKEEI